MSNKVLIVVLFALLTTGTNLYAASEFKIFGIELLDSVTEHFTKKQIRSKERNLETIGKYYDIQVNHLKNTNPQFEYFYVTIDSQNAVHAITGHKFLKSSLRNCRDKLAPDFVSAFEKKYSKKLEYKEASYTDFNTYQHSVRDKGSNLFRIQCKEGFESGGYIVLQVFYQSEELLDSISSYYNKSF